METRSQEDACTLEPLDASRFPWLFWGDKKVARNEQLLRRRKITYIINCTPPCGEGGVPNFHERAIWGCRNTFRYLRIPVYDTQAETLQPHFEEVWEFMETCRTREDGNVLIHCNHGVSRSVAFVCSYLIRFEGMSCEEALAFVRRKNPLAKPNDGFRDQLKQLHERVLREARSGGSEPRQLQRGGSWVPPSSSIRKRVVACSLPCPRPRSKVKRQMGPLRPPQLAVEAAPQSNEEPADSAASVEAEEVSSPSPSRPLSLSAPPSPSEAADKDPESFCTAGDRGRLALPTAANAAASGEGLTSGSPVRDDGEFADDTATTVGNVSPLETPRAIASPTANTQDTSDWVRVTDGGKEAFGCKDGEEPLERDEVDCRALAPCV